MEMKIAEFSSIYQVFEIQDKDIPKVFALCAENPTYYEFMKPFVTHDSIKKDMQALPPGKGYEDKFYVGFSQNHVLAAVMDLIAKYPNGRTAFIGFFMMNKEMQGKGIGSAIIKELLTYLKKAGFTYVRLGYIKGNEESKNFWYKNGFIQTGYEKETDNHTIVVLQHEL